MRMTSSTKGLTRGSTVTTENLCATGHAISIDASAVPTTGTGEISRAA
jgi:hypothetical protein